MTTSFNAMQGAILVLGETQAKGRRGEQRGRAKESRQRKPIRGSVQRVQCRAGGSKLRTWGIGKRETEVVIKVRCDCGEGDRDLG